MDSLGNNPGILMKSLVLIGDVCFGFKKKKTGKIQNVHGEKFSRDIGLGRAYWRENWEFLNSTRNFFLHLVAAPFYS